MDGSARDVPAIFVRLLIDIGDSWLDPATRDMSDTPDSLISTDDLDVARITVVKVQPRRKTGQVLVA